MSLHKSTDAIEKILARKWRISFAGARQSAKNGGDDPEQPQPRILQSGAVLSTN